VVCSHVPDHLLSYEFQYWRHYIVFAAHLSLGYRQNRAVLFRSLFLCFRYLFYFSFLSVFYPYFGDFWLLCFRLFVASWSFCGLSIGGYRQCLGLGFQRMIGLSLPSSLFSILYLLPELKVSQFLVSLGSCLLITLPLSALCAQEGTSFWLHSICIRTLILALLDHIFNEVARVSRDWLLFIYRMSIKSLYNCKNLLQRLDFFLWGYIKDIDIVYNWCPLPFCRHIIRYMAVQVYISAIPIPLNTHMHASDHTSSFTSNTNACVLKTYEFFFDRMANLRSKIFLRLPLPGAIFHG
jgi:hypothetical protein